MQRLIFYTIHNPPFVFFFQTNQYNLPVISVPDESSESSSQIIMTSDNQILGIPTNTYYVLAENQGHFIEKTQENSDLKNILDNINVVLENHDKNMDTILENQKKICRRWLAFLSKLIICNYKLVILMKRMLFPWGHLKTKLRTYDLVSLQLQLLKI